MPKFNYAHTISDAYTSGHFVTMGFQPLGNIDMHPTCKAIYPIAKF